MPEYNPAAWDSFFVGNAGAAAALAGLLFVGVSINLATIVGSGALTRRALEAFALLAGVLVVSVLVLTPGLSSPALAAGLAGTGAATWTVVTAIHLRARAGVTTTAGTGPPRWSTAVRIVLGQAATVSVLVGAATLAAESGGGLYWLVPAVALSYIAALANAWVLLVEILR